MIPVIQEQPGAGDGRPWLVLDPAPGGGLHTRSSHASYAEALTAYARPNTPNPTRPVAVLDPVAAWSLLTPQQQAEIGILALVVALGSSGAFDSRGHEVAYAEGITLLEGTALEALGRPAKPPRPDLRPIGLRTCTGCGCTDRHGCEAGCSWAGPELCSCCAEQGAPARLGRR